MGFTDADAPVDEKWVVALAQLFDDFESDHARHLIGVTGNQSIKIEIFVQMMVFIQIVLFGFACRCCRFHGIGRICMRFGHWGGCVRCGFGCLCMAIFCCSCLRQSLGLRGRFCGFIVAFGGFSANHKL